MDVKPLNTKNISLLSASRKQNWIKVKTKLWRVSDTWVHTKSHSSLIIITVHLQVTKSKLLSN